MAMVDGLWTDDNDPFKNPYTQGGGGNPYVTSGADASESANARPYDPVIRTGGSGTPALTGPSAPGGGLPTMTDDFRRTLLSTPDLSPLAARYGMSRDALAEIRDNEGRQLEQQLRTRAAAQGLRLDQGAGPSGALQSNGFDVDRTLQTISAAQRGDSAAQTSPGIAGASRDNYNIPYPGFQFTDPYTRQLEDTVRQQIAQLSQPQSNPALDKLLTYLGNRFQALTTSPGYSPEDLAVMRTQALDPIEADRQTAKQRALERTSARGMLPSSGLNELDLEGVDLGHDQLRAQAQRDLAINQITKRQTDLNQAAQIGQLAGVQIPGAQRSEDQQRREELIQLASLLYDLPARAEQQAMSVVNGTSGPQDLFAQAQGAQQAAQRQQQLNEERYAQLAQVIAGLNF